MNANLLKEMRDLKIRYEKGENIIQYIDKKYGDQVSRTDSIMASYDLQAGTYTKRFDADPEKKMRYCDELAGKLSEIDPVDSFLLVGVGEAITLGNVVPKLPEMPQSIFGFDISWSRVDYANNFIKRFNLRNVLLSTGNIFEAPFMDNSIELVMSNHSLEPNGGREKEALKELFRISRRYIVLNEPCYEFASKEAQERIEKHGYVKNLHRVAEKLNYKIICHEIFDNPVSNLNPTSCLIIEKEEGEKSSSNKLACPLTKTPLHRGKDCYFSRDSLLAYPIIKGIPCLLSHNAVLASSFER